jgi:DNA polymerase-3 subunit alpha
MNISHLLSSRSDFSIGESMLQIDHLIADAKEKGYESVTLMDTMSIHGLVDFSNKCKKAGLKPIIGCRLRVVEDPTYRKPPKASGEREKPNPMFMLKAYITSDKGVTGLMKLLSRAYSDEYFYYHARVGLADVVELQDVLISTGDLFGLYHLDNASTIVRSLQDRFGRDNVYSELTPINTPLFDTLNGKAIEAAQRLDMPTLVTYPVFYRDKDSADSLEVLKCITSNTKMDVRYRSIQHVKDFYIQEPRHLVPRVKAAAGRVHKWAHKGPPALWIQGLENIEKLVGKCHYQFEKQPVSLPKMAENEFMALGKKCIEGWKKRFGREIFGHKPSNTEMKVYQDRLAYELSVLKKMGFAGYFLLVEDLVVWAKSNDIIVGPGRGSVGGSLVAYLIGITDVDPIRFNLLFERFINPERLDLPDADLDFMSSKRHMVIEYLTAKYGADRVAGISNYSTLASASALRDTGRVYGLNGIELTATKLVPKEHGQSFTLTDAAKAVPEIDKFKEDQPEIWGHALHLEGAMRAFGRHAAGVVVAGEPLINRAVVETRSDAPIVSWDKRTVEDWGLVKMDILGLSTLDVMEIAKGYIRDRHGIEIDYLTLPFEEPRVMDAFGRGDTTGVFQFESPGMRKLLRDLAVGGQLTFEDITAATALYRPGPMDSGLLDDYVAIKQGIRSPTYDHPCLTDVLGDTYGVVVYQEQTMALSRSLCGFTATEADNLRRAIGKKDLKKMAEMKPQFVEGASAGFVEVTLDNGEVKKVHRLAKLAVVGRQEKMTVEEIFARGIEPIL